jgi:hypothetical protein
MHELFQQGADDNAVRRHRQQQRKGSGGSTTSGGCGGGGGGGSLAEGAKDVGVSRQVSRWARSAKRFLSIDDDGDGSDGSGSEEGEAGGDGAAGSADAADAAGGSTVSTYVRTPPRENRQFSPDHDPLTPMVDTMRRMSAAVFGR